MKADHEGKGSAASVPNAEKWSHKAIVASVCRNSKLRRIRGRIRGLTSCKSAGMMIPRKQIVIKKLLAKYPQWGIACVDGVLVDWEG
ncbi:hypothetical protein [Nostoc sp. UIC 10630]|uniref:hypothetical protein n=1 Tax=Nostoc sp. UIC 10630 TaxID=2100146 RepID=UPI0013D1814D|nr:hypothetical protein [Nostoc sp. UIC 10630]NEU82764.1 hypothetical protein [Nostoc sp. UIC 10630]